jgi:Fe-S-cluster containining protein
MPSTTRRQGNFFETCSRCKTSWSCCHETTPPITNRRRKIIEAYLETNEVGIEGPFIRTEYVFPRLDAQGYCVFHDKKTRKCLIHPVKPETCVAGPVTFDINLKNGKVEWFIKTEKICPLAQRVYKDKTLLETHLRTAKKEISRLVNDLDSEALRAILEKDEPQTFKIGEDKIGKNVLNRLADS